MKSFRNYIPCLILMIIAALIMVSIDTTTSYICASTFGSMLWDSGSDNMGGYKNRILFIPDSAVSATPLIPKVKAADADYVTASGAFTFKTTGETPTPIYATRATVSYKADIQGETDCKSYKISGEFFHPGNKIDAAAFARKVCNTPGYLIIESPDGQQQIVGQPGLPCTVSASFDGGKAPADKRGWTFTYEADSMAPIIVMGTPIDIDAAFSS